MAGNIEFINKFHNRQLWVVRLQVRNQRNDYSRKRLHATGATDDLNAKILELYTGISYGGDLWLKKIEMIVNAYDFKVSETHEI